ncbi:MAG: phosphopyruvate hydratase, partial [Bdellovibrionales bacterium]|nr:phosphopyruvate hydratase [Bdellovibrionales bacterium]
MSIISRLKGREIIDSRGRPTVEVEVFLENGLMARAAVPSGASTGKYEALELRDGEEHYFFKKGVKKAVENVSFISSKLKGRDVTDQKKIDACLL